MIDERFTRDASSLATAGRRGTGQRRRVGRTSRVLRGGSWNNNDRDNLLSSYRNNNDPGNRNNNNGFRCVLVVSGSKVLSLVTIRRMAVSGEPAASVRKRMKT
jgi:hypothetical protein